MIQKTQSKEGKLGIVRLINAVFYAHHGVMQEEHKIGGRYEVDVEMEVDFASAGASDNLEDTADYVVVYNLIKQIVTENKFYLIEKLAFLIAEAILAEVTIIFSAQVTVRKINPPVGGPCDRAEVVYKATR